MKQIFGRRMRTRRSELGMTLQELAERLQASRAYLNQIELGNKNLTLEMAQKIANALDIP
ncbi:MAG: helix-turn-helix transcriptional regulator [Caldilineaceae bacterium]